MKRTPHRQHAWNEDQMAKLDAQGRHRSEWCYAPYDGRYTLPKPNGQDYEVSSQDETLKYYTK